jgi:hypothetical protein
MPLKKIDLIVDNVLVEIKKHMDMDTFILAEKIIENSIRMVLINLDKKFKSQVELECAIKKVQGNMINFIALVVMQLKAFGNGENCGPFIELCEQLLLNNPSREIDA